MDLAEANIGSLTFVFGMVANFASSSRISSLRNAAKFFPCSSSDNVIEVNQTRIMNIGIIAFTDIGFIRIIVVHSPY